jgi:hypothetical protein
MVNSWIRRNPYQATLAAGSSFLPTYLAPSDTVAYRQGSARLQLDLELNAPIR